MDERRRSNPVIIPCLFMLMMLVGGKCTPLGDFEQCYVGSFIFCIIIPTNTAYMCSLKSLRDCIPSSPPSAETLGVADAVMKKKKGTTDYFCRFGCASSLCANISTQHSPGGMKVANCVNSCSEKCSHG